MNQTNHEIYIQKCLDLAKAYQGQTSPNPLVGSVIVKNGLIISSGAHKKAGTDHAELDAIKNATESLKGATLYCNLEPCCHTNKKTPPCAQRIINEEISEVVISNLDPNPLVAGNGVKLLKEAGIKVTTGILKDEASELNKVFFTNMLLKRPFIHLKWAQSIDGKMATSSGDSKWITNEESRKNVHHERSIYDSILIGANTLKNDNPRLTIRLEGQIERCPYRIVIASQPDTSKDLFNDEFKDKTIIVNGKLSDILNELYQKDIMSIYVEGGAMIHSQFLSENLFDEISIYTAPKILGSGKSITLPEIINMREAFSLSDCTITNFGSDTLTNFRRKLCLPDL